MSRVSLALPKANFLCTLSMQNSLSWPGLGDQCGVVQLVPGWEGGTFSFPCCLFKTLIQNGYASVDPNYVGLTSAVIGR